MHTLIRVLVLLTYQETSQLAIQNPEEAPFKVDFETWNQKPKFIL